MAKSKTSLNLPDSLDTNSKALLFAHSSAAAPGDTKNDAVVQCIVAAFAKQGLKHISSMADQIVWQNISSAIVDNIAQAIRTCVTQSVSDPGDLIGSFRVLKGHNRVMTVSDLADGIVELL